MFDNISVIAGTSAVLRNPQATFQCQCPSVSPCCRADQEREELTETDWWLASFSSYKWPRKYWMLSEDVREGDRKLFLCLENTPQPWPWVDILTNKYITNLILWKIYGEICQFKGISSHLNFEIFFWTLALASSPVRQPHGSRWKLFLQVVKTASQINHYQQQLPRKKISIIYKITLIEICCLCQHPHVLYHRDILCCKEKKEI